MIMVVDSVHFSFVNENVVRALKDDDGDEDRDRDTAGNFIN